MLIRLIQNFIIFEIRLSFRPVKISNICVDRVVLFGAMNKTGSKVNVYTTDFRGVSSSSKSASSF